MLANAQELKPVTDFTNAHEDYETVRTVLQHITENWRDHPDLDQVFDLNGRGDAGMNVPGDTANEGNGLLDQRLNIGRGIALGRGDGLLQHQLLSWLRYQ